MTGIFLFATLCMSHHIPRTPSHEFSNCSHRKSGLGISHFLTHFLDQLGCFFCDTFGGPSQQPGEGKPAVCFQPRDPFLPIHRVSWYRRRLSSQQGFMGTNKSSGRGYPRATPFPCPKGVSGQPPSTSHHPLTRPLYPSFVEVVLRGKTAEGGRGYRRPPHPPSD